MLLREKCPYSELLWSECGKMWTSITPNMDTFYAVLIRLVLDITAKLFSILVIKLMTFESMLKVKKTKKTAT